MWLRLRGASVRAPRRLLRGAEVKAELADDEEDSRAQHTATSRASFRHAEALYPVCLPRAGFPSRDVTHQHMHIHDRRVSVELRALGAPRACGRDRRQPWELAGLFRRLAMLPPRELLCCSFRFLWRISVVETDVETNKVPSHKSAMSKNG